MKSRPDNKGFEFAFVKLNVSPHKQHICTCNCEVLRNIVISLCI